MAVERAHLQDPEHGHPGRAGRPRPLQRRTGQARRVVPGDLITVRTPGWEHRFEVVQLLDRRVGAPLARAAYRDLSPERPAHLSAPVARRERGSGRPTKKERREIERLRGR